MYEKPDAPHTSEKPLRPSQWQVPISGKTQDRYSRENSAAYWNNPTILHESIHPEAIRQPALPQLQERFQTERSFPHSSDVRRSEAY